jgi:DtxR family transcriptional regulator, Mn-dependent transcriptional regulator
MSGHSHFAESIEEYLEAVYRLEREGPGVTTSGLASTLGVAPASVSGMLKKLERDGHVEYVARGEVKLTRSGLEVAVRVLRRHRLAERLLTEEACMLEHAISERVELQLMKLLNDPETCPHGHPIPPKDLSDPKRVGMPLAQIEAGCQTAVVGVTEEVPEILRYLGQVGLRPGAKVNVIEKAPLGGPLTVEVENGRHAISLELARMVMVAEPA